MEKKKKTLQREILEIIGAFVIAWIAYQVIAAVAGTPLPIVSVVSDSMYHTNYFDKWWNNTNGYYIKIGITKEQFMGFTAPNGLSRGDLLFVIKPDNLKTGDILIYNKFSSDFTIVHRLIEIQKDFYTVKGDNNPVPDPPVAKQYVVGKVVFTMPILGYPRLILHMVGI